MPLPQAQDKLVPLRKFSSPGVYSAAYLSQLVQRKKLKAKKVGRNYFTCETWFNEYLETYARDAKQAAYIEEKKQDIPEITDDNANVIAVESSAIISRPIAKRLNLIAISMAIFVLLSILVNIFIYLDSKKGTVAGESENYGVATSSEYRDLRN